VMAWPIIAHRYLSDDLRAAVLRNILDFGHTLEDEIIPGSLGMLQSPDDREPDAHRWILDELVKRTKTDYADGLMTAMDIRRDYIPRYGFVLPTRELIDTIKNHAPNGVLDFGCGNGYLSFLLQQNGIESIPIDECPPEENGNSYWMFDRHKREPLPASAKRHWTTILYGDIEDVKRAPVDIALLLSWPPMNDMAARATLEYKGDMLMYIGERYDGCTGNEQFETILDTAWDEIMVAGTSFQGVHDRLHVFSRKK
jgi:hypothetical protein